MKPRLILLILLPFLLSCQHMPAGTPKTRQEQEDDIREAMFRYLFKQVALTQTQQAHAFYLAIYDTWKYDTKDPDTNLMKRFIGDAPPVKKASQCTTEVETGLIFPRNSVPSYTDKTPSNWGIIFIVGNIEWITEDIVVADGNYQKSWERSTYRICLLERKNSRWFIMSGIEPVHNENSTGFRLIPVRTVKKKPMAQEDDIREAVFRYQFKRNLGLQGQCAGAYYLTFIDTSGKNKDPDVKFMQRFTGNTPPIKGASQCTTGFGSFISCKGDTYQEFGVVDRKTGKTGLQFTVGEIDWLRKDFVVVDGSCYEYNMGAEGDLFYVIKESNRWVVKGKRMIWVS